MGDKFYLELLFLLVCAGCTAAEDLPENCSIGVRCRERLTWLNVSTLTNSTMRCLAEIEKSEAELQKYREKLMKMRNFINERRRSRGEEDLPEPVREMPEEQQTCLAPMFCNGKPLWSPLFVRDPVIGKIQARCSYEVKRARGRLDIMKAEYKLIAHELAKEKKLFATAVSRTAENATSITSTVTDISGDTSTIIPTTKSRAATMMEDDESATYPTEKTTTAISTDGGIITANPTETTLSETVEDSTVIGSIGSTTEVCPPYAWGPGSTMCLSTLHEVASTQANYVNEHATSITSTVTDILGDTSTIIPTAKSRAATMMEDDESATYPTEKTTTAIVTNGGISTANPTEKTLSATVEVDCSTSEHVIGPNGYNYSLLTTMFTWNKAIQACAEEGGTLPRKALTNPDTYGFLENCMMSRPEHNGYWLSLNDKSNESEWKYDNGEIFSGISHWSTSPIQQPDNTGNQDCLSARGRYDYKWDDYWCWKTATVICEIEP